MHTILLGQIILEVTIHWGQFPVEEVARKTHMFRATGLGIANTASIHMLMGHPYDSEESRNVASSLMSIMTGYSYFTSALMAKKLGAFEKYDINKTSMLEVIRNHARVSGARTDKYERFSYKPVKLNHNILHKLGLGSMSNLTKNVWNNTVELGEKCGFRNAQVTVIAPTGTIAFAMSCEATSIEPFFAHSIYKKLAGGGGMMIVNPLIPQVLKKLGYNDEEIKIASKEIEIGEIESCDIIKKEHLSIFDTANKCGKGQRYISPMGHVKMMASLTPMVSGAISKTVNLPKEATVEEISSIFIESYRLGVKGLTVYRDGSKASQPLNTTTGEVSEVTKFEELQYKDLVKIAYKFQKDNSEFPKRNRPSGILSAKKHEAIIDGIKLLINVAFYDDGKLAEIYIVADKEGSLIKGLLDSLSKLISKMIQYSIPVEDIIRTLKGQKYEPHGYVSLHPYIKFVDSISDLVSKILEIEIGDYSSCQVKPKTETKVVKKAIKVSESNQIPIKEETIKPKAKDISKIKGRKLYGQTCPECGSDKMIQNGVCKVCANCGQTTGCS